MPRVGEEHRRLSQRCVWSREQRSWTDGHTDRDQKHPNVRIWPQLPITELPQFWLTHLGDVSLYMLLCKKPPQIHSRGAGSRGSRLVTPWLAPQRPVPLGPGLRGPSRAAVQLLLASGNVHKEGSREKPRQQKSCEVCCPGPVTPAAVQRR